MKNFECPECGDVKLSREWEYCENERGGMAMAEIVSWGKNGPSDKAVTLATKIKAEKDAINP